MTTVKLYPGTDEDIERLARDSRHFFVSRFESARGVGVSGDNIADLLRFSVCDVLGGSIKIDNSISLDSSGGSLVIDGDKLEIYLSPFTSPIRDNFTIAHELGHYALHYLLATPKPEGRIVFHRFGRNTIEIQANRFAAAFLMPQDEFRSAVARHNGDDYAIAGTFGVSADAARIRRKYVVSQ